MGVAALEREDRGLCRGGGGEREDRGPRRSGGEGRGGGEREERVLHALHGDVEP